ncbi:MAG: TIGR03668 family PPOX class F420-dependent oxidoreductase [Actinobacteria bacterium]|nr:TIGR03668 family PPOX class F420-dependent oxidoreductase [Actinomycetota bacterium]
MDASEMRARFANARVARLATVDEHARPHLVPVCFATEGDAIFSAVDAKPKSTTALRRLDNIAAHPAVSLLVDEYFEDWTRLWWVRADGDAHVVESGPEHRDAIDRLAAKYPQYRARPPDGAVVAVQVRRWRGWTWNG